MRRVTAARRGSAPGGEVRRPAGCGRGTPLLALLLVSLLFSLSAAPALAISPSLDGFVIYNGGSVAISGSVHAIAWQRRDGKILVGGDFTLTGAAQTRKNIARINPDGTLDTSFVPPLLDGPVHALALQPDPAGAGNPDLVLIGGGFTAAGASSRRGVARLSGSDGSLDPGFDPVTAPVPVTVNAMVLLPGGTGILLGGSFAAIKAGVPSRNLAGVSVAGATSGELDWSCVGGLGDDAGNVAVHALALQNGSVLVGGEFATPWSTNVARFSASGSYDTGFRPPALTGAVRALAVQEDGCILVGGDFSGGALGRNYLVRLGQDGTPDGFDAGLVQAPGNRVSSLLLQSDGKILVGGEFTAGPPLAQRRNLARVNIDGSLSGAVFPPADGAVRALARQGDGKILAGGDFGHIGVVARTSLARFYAEQGALDDDLPQVVTDPWGMVIRSYLASDGSTVLVGPFTGVLDEPVSYSARLKQDWTLDRGFGPLEFQSRIFSLAELPERGMLLGGEFFTVNGLPQHELVQVDQAGVPGPALFNSTVDSYLNAGWGWINTMVQPADGSLTEDGMIYAGGDADAPSIWRYLARFGTSGVRDDGFRPPVELDGVVNFLAIQRGDLLLVATNNGKVLRLLPGGALDPAWNGGVPLQFGGEVDTLLVLPDGRILVGGDLRYPGVVTDPGTGLPVVLSRNLVRLSPDGVIDDGFIFEARSTNPVYPSLINNVALQVDGAMLISGIFNRLFDGFGGVLDRTCVARVDTLGHLDSSFDLAIPVPGWGPAGLVNSVTLQPDGKFIVAGDFVGVAGKSKVARFANGWSAQELQVSPAGDTVTWLRSGSTPELWRVSFDFSTNPDAASPVWLPLGEAHRIPGGWQLDHLDLASLGVKANRYVRARGLVLGEPGGAGSLVESVRLYYLKPQNITVTVTAAVRSKSYGEADPPLTYSFDPPLNGSDRFTGELSRVSGEDVGVYAITRGTLALGSGYDLVFNGANLTITRAPLRVVAQDKSRAYLTPNPELTPAYQGFVFGEGSSVLSGAPELATPATLTSPVGSYAIVAGTGTLQAANYRLVPVSGTLTVFPSCQEITFPAIPERTFGDPPFEIVASACSGLQLSFRSSNPEVAQVNGNVITITGAGSAVITASQAGTGNLETAPEKSQTFVVQRSGQQVSFSSLAQKVVGDPPFDLEGSASSGLPLSYASSDPAVATVAGSTVTVVGAGTTVLSALQGGSGNYLPALPVSRTLTVAQEGTPPQLYLSTLNSGATTANPVLNIMGRASDAAGIASLTVAGVERSADAALFSAAVTLAEGDNAIAVTARDGAGNVTTHSFTVTLDALAPVLTLTAPADNSVTDAISCAVSGTVTPGSTVTMAVNGAALQLLPVSGGSFTGSALLAEGVNTIELHAQREGRSSRSKRSVTFDPAAPALAVTDPVQDLRTEAASITMRGTVGSAAVGGVLLQGAGALYTPEVVGGAFQQQLSLALGDNRVTVRAVSGDGTVSLAQRNLVRIERISGDLDGNGSVDIQDALQLLKISLGREPATAVALAHGDLAPVVNGVSRPDGVIDVGDLLVLLRKIVGLSGF